MAETSAPGLFDTHCHLNHPRLLGRLPEVLDRAQAAGVVGIVVVGFDLPSSRQAVELADRYEGLWATVGIHPHDAASIADRDFVELRALARLGKVVAIGETGLDFYRDLSPRAAQRKAFEQHLELAAEVGLATVIHCRDAQDDVVEAVRAHVERKRDHAADRQRHLIWHCFEGTLDQMRQALSLGMVFGVSGRITHRAATELRNVLARIPREHLLLETDAPYLAPEPYRSRDNEPANLPLVAQALAAARKEGEDALVSACTENARGAFGLDGGSR